MTSGDPPRLALDLRQIGPDDEIAALDVAAGDQVVEGHVDRVEVIDQRLAGMSVVDQEAVEALLLYHDRSGTFGGRCSVPSLAWPLASRAAASRIVCVIGLGAAVERGQRLVAARRTSSS